LLEVAERYIVLLLGVRDVSVPSLWHLQKEIFLASMTVPKMGEVFDFRKHYYGPYSQTLQELAEEPMYLDDPYRIQSNRSVCITASGKKILRQSNFRV